MEEDRLEDGGSSVLRLSILNFVVSSCSFFCHVTIILQLNSSSGISQSHPF